MRSGVWWFVIWFGLVWEAGCARQLCVKLSRAFRSSHFVSICLVFIGSYHFSHRVRIQCVLEYSLNLLVDRGDRGNPSQTGHRLREPRPETPIARRTLVCPPQRSSIGGDEDKVTSQAFSFARALQDPQMQACLHEPRRRGARPAPTVTPP